MRVHFLDQITLNEKVEIIDYLERQDYSIPISKNKIISTIGISKSSYYSVKNHVKSATELRRDEVKSRIYLLFYEFKKVYGAPKIHAELIKRYGDKYASLRTVAVYMQQMGLVSITVPKFKGMSNTEQQLPFNIPMVNYIKTDRPSAPHTHILTDITYIYTVTNGWTYLLSFMDMYTRKILAWDLSDTMTAEWVTRIAKELKDAYPSIIFIHSDRGSQYTSKQYLEYLLTNGISPSFSSKGYPYHNAWIESFHAQLKKEYIYRRTLSTVDEAKQACFKYIEGFYNRIRSQQALGYLSPNEFELQFKQPESLILVKAA